ncbi:MAG: glycosyltransferase family 2 protein [Candidatus Methylacidiphilales bacterium]|nr:glycosyltransferase family 2 protein [Candidatus Methylacidiphilales bacterium]
MKPAEVTPVILTWNEEANIARTLEALHWAERIVILDSGSTDETEAICRSNPRVDFHVRKFDRHADQWNAGLSLVRTPWVLALDADYRLGPEFPGEMERLDPDAGIDGYRVPLLFCQGGHPLRASLLPPRICLFRTGRARYRQDGHTQDLQLDGPCGTMTAPILHDDRKPFSRWWSNQLKYAALEADKLRESPWHELSPQDRLRKATPLAPLAVAAYCLLIKGLWLDFPAGWLYTGQRFLAECLLLSARLRK